MPPPPTTLQYGAHATYADGMCLMEAVAFINGEAINDHSPAVDVALAALARAINDVLTDAERNALLVPLIVPLDNTAGDPDLTLRRSYLTVDLCTRQVLVTLFGFVGLTDVDAALSAIAPVVDDATLNAAFAAVSAAWSAAGSSGLPWKPDSLLRGVAENIRSTMNSAVGAARGEILDRASSRVIPMAQLPDASYAAMRAVMVNCIVSVFSPAIALT